MADDSRPKLVCLGPLGTYSHQGAYDQFGDNVEYIDRPCIKDVFETVSSDIPLGLVPQENTIFGAVTETYDALRHSSLGKTLFVRGEVTLAVQHCLVARKGVKLEDIDRILSHEQALGQCSGFIEKHFPTATIEKKPSTALAAQTLLDDDERNISSAAICSALCAKLFDGLEILQRGVQDTNINFTRFYVLSNSLDAILPVVRRVPQFRRALVRLSLPPTEPARETHTSEEDEEELLPKPAHNRTVHLILGTLLTTFGVPAIRIDRRPSMNPCPFEDTYFIELEDFGTPEEPSSTGPSALEEAWLRRVRQGAERVTAAGAQADVIGVW